MMVAHDTDVRPLSCDQDTFAGVEDSNHDVAATLSYPSPLLEYKSRVIPLARSVTNRMNWYDELDQCRQGSKPVRSRPVQSGAVCMALRHTRPIPAAVIALGAYEFVLRLASTWMVPVQ